MSHYKPYPAYKDSGVEWIGRVPEHWEVKPMCRVASCNDDTLPEDVQPDHVLRYVDISSVNHADGITEVAELRFADAPSRARRRAKAGDVVISTVRTYLKAVAAVTGTHADCIYSTGFAVLRPRPSEVEPPFLKWMTLNDLVIQAIEAHSEGLSYPAINATELVKLKAVVPPPAEQAAIAAALDRETARIDALIAKKTRFIELLKEKRQALITHAVTKGLSGLRHSSEEPPASPHRHSRESGNPDSLRHSPEEPPAAHHRHSRESGNPESPGMAPEALDSRLRGNDGTEVPMKDSGVEWIGEVPEHWEVIPSTWLFVESNERAHADDEHLSATQKYGVIPLAEYERLEARQVTHAVKNTEQRKHVEIDNFVISMRSFEGGIERVRARGCVRSSYVVLVAEPRADIGFYSYLLTAC